MRKTGISLTRQDEVLSYIKEYMDKNSYAPTVREVADGVGFKSPSSAAKYLDALEDSGYIRRRPESPRTIEIVGSATKQGFEMTQIPLLKDIVIDMPLFSRENIKGYFSMPSDYIGAGATVFAIEAKDGSMRDEGILEDAVVFVEGQVSVSNGDCVLCLADGRALIRFIYMEEEQVRLVPASNEYRTETVSSCQVVGRVTGIFKSMVLR